MSKTRIILTGAQGTGKTTILNHYKEQGMNVITEVVRNLAKEGVKINEMGNEEGQKKIFDTYKKLLGSKKSYMSDRGLTDVASYTFYHATQEVISKKFADSEYRQMLTFFKNNPDVIVCYFPIEFKVEDDGVRSTDEDFRASIDFILKGMLDSLGIHYVTIKGTVDERIKQIDKVIADNENITFGIDVANM